MKQFISFSGGVESTTMCVLYGHRADAIFADTGWEHDVIYARLDKVEAWVREYVRADFTIHRVRAMAKIKGETVTSLPDYIRASKYFPFIKARYCTREFKIAPIDAFLLSLSEACEILIGLNADEADSRTGNHGLIDSVVYSYPLVTAGLNRVACIRILDQVGLAPNFPAYMKRGGCKGCFFKSKAEYQAMAMLSEAEYDEVAGLELEVQDRRGSLFAIRSDIPEGLAAAKKRFVNQLFPPDQMYPDSELQTSCGVFCHR